VYFLGTNCGPDELTKSTELTSSEVNGPSASQDFPFLLWNPNVHCRFHESLSTVTVLTQVKLVLIPFCLFKFRFNIIILFSPRPSEVV
jgi:hypothetical protein